MAANYRDYLAIHVINEGEIVSYRNLSRALKVHSNRAKEMLFDFYESQTSRKPGSLNATYLIAGLRKPEPQSSNGVNEKGDEDSIMGDSSFMSSSIQVDEESNAQKPIHVTSITLAKEEDLDEVKSLYEEIRSIHIYSLSPSPFKDLQMLSDCNRRVASEYAAEDPLEVWKQYGTIQNRNVRRRTTRRLAPSQGAALVAKTAGMKSDTKTESTAKSSTKLAPKISSLKKENSNLFASFAKSKSEEPKRGSQSAALGSLTQDTEDSHPEDETMDDVSEGEEDDAFALDASKEAKEKAEAVRQAKRDREENLRKMMEDDNDDQIEASAAKVEATDAPDAAEDDDEEPVNPELNAEPQPTVSDGRRRGRRKVMKKRTTKDAEGYLVTKEEAVWESFSEDEPEKKTKPANISNMGSKVKKVANPGQGKISSFFGKN